MSDTTPERAKAEASVAQPGPHDDTTAVPAWYLYEDLTGDREKVVLMGDSVLDNFIWLRNPSRWLRNVVEECLPHYSCVNLAVDQMTTFDILKRSPAVNGWAQYQHGRERVFRSGIDRAGYRPLRAHDGCIYSAANLHRLKNVKHVVLSIGGNDVYLTASVQAAFARSLLPFCNAHEQVGREFGERMQLVVEKLNVPPSARFMAVLVYHPHHEFSISGLNSGCLGALAKCIQRRNLSYLATPMARAALRIAKTRRFPVLDLSCTFDPTNVRHYGNMDVNSPEWSGAEPSDVSQEYIAQLITHVVQRYDSGEDVGPCIVSGVVEGDKMVAVKETMLTDEYIDKYIFSK
eukprot:Sspe_Gene.37577::Locus_18137_Transcript_1_1_Confidence_1.000_Length_3564::g.37577::m.37577